MREIFDLLESTWASYEIGETYIFLAVLLLVFLLWRNWQKTSLGIWAVLYSWTMWVLLSSPGYDLQEGFNAVWVCTFGLLGFIALGGLIYQVLKS